MSNFLKAIDYYNSDISLEHHGVKGMRWGVRTQKQYVPVGQRQESVDSSYDSDYDSNLCHLRCLDESCGCSNGIRRGRYGEEHSQGCAHRNERNHGIHTADGHELGIVGG